MVEENNNKKGGFVSGAVKEKSGENKKILTKGVKKGATTSPRARIDKEVGFHSRSTILE